MELSRREFITALGLASTSLYLPGCSVKSPLPSIKFLEGISGHSYKKGLGSAIAAAKKASEEDFFEELSILDTIEETYFKLDNISNKGKQIISEDSGIVGKIHKKNGKEYLITNGSTKIMSDLNSMPTKGSKWKHLSTYATLSLEYGDEAVHIWGREVGNEQEFIWVRNRDNNSQYDTVFLTKFPKVIVPVANTPDEKISKALLPLITLVFPPLYEMWLKYDVLDMQGLYREEIAQEYIRQNYQATCNFDIFVGVDKLDYWDNSDWLLPVAGIQYVQRDNNPYNVKGTRYDLFGINHFFDENQSGILTLEYSRGDEAISKMCKD